MASVREYLEKMPTDQLEGILYQQIIGADSIPLSSIYLICDVLSRREPARGTAGEIFQEFARRYAGHRRFSKA